jgi:hypothetical protein
LGVGIPFARRHARGDEEAFGVSAIDQLAVWGWAGPPGRRRRRFFFPAFHVGVDVEGPPDRAVVAVHALTCSIRLRL